MLTRQEIMTFLTGLTEFQRGVVNRHWEAVHGEIAARADAKRPKPKMYEVHHEVELARMAFLEALMVSSAEHASEEARKRVSLIEPVDIVHVRADGLIGTVVHKTFTVTQAEEWLATSATVDPDDLEAGCYTIDYPEWMEEIVQRGAAVQSTMAQLAQTDAVGQAANVALGFERPEGEIP